jgi:hypothetical protein
VDEPRKQESDQLPEEAPEQQIVDDEVKPARSDAEESPGVPGEEGQATGSPENAG